MKIFVSHAWDRSDLYVDLVSMLGGFIGFDWTNLSIPKDEAIELATGQSQVEQRRRFLAERMRAIERRLRAIERHLDAIKVQIQSVKSEQAELREATNVDVTIQRTRENLVAPGAFEKLARLERLKCKYTKSASLDTVSQLELRVEDLMGSQRHLEHEADHLIQNYATCQRETSSLSIEQLAKFGSPGRALYKTYPNLALAIGNRITEAHVVLIISLTNSAFLKWIEFEYDEAINRRKYVFALLHPTVCPRLPPDLKVNDHPPIAHFR